MKTQKHFMQSKTIIFNFIFLALAMFDRTFFETLGVGPEAIPKIEVILVKICAIGNLALRYFGDGTQIKKITGDDQETKSLVMVMAFILAL
jgi:hypothetical protein